MVGDLLGNGISGTASNHSFIISPPLEYFSFFMLGFQKPHKVELGHDGYRAVTLFPQLALRFHACFVS
jgi:hypothetical protein